MSAWFNKFLAVVTVSAGVNVAAQAQSNEPILPTLPGWEDTEVISGGSHQAAQRNQQAKQQAQGQKTVVLVPCRDANGELVFKMKEVDPSTIQEVENVSSQSGARSNQTAKKQAYTDIYNYDGGKGKGISVAHEDGSRILSGRNASDISALSVLYRVKAFLQVCPIEFFLWNHLYSYIFSVLLNLIDVF